MRLRPVGVLALLAILSAGCGGGGRPQFRAAPGWHVLSEPGPTMSAANVPLAAADRSSSAPERTVASLRPRGIVIWVQWVRRGELHHSNPRRPLPLRVPDASSGQPEGLGCGAEPPCAFRNLQAAESGWDLDVWIFFGNSKPSASEIAAANAELARLSV